MKREMIQSKRLRAGAPVRLGALRCVMLQPLHCAANRCHWPLLPAMLVNDTKGRGIACEMAPPAALKIGA